MATGKKTGGRVAGTPNKATDSIKAFLGRLIPESELEKRWNYFLNHADPAFRWKAFELANAYMFGKPAMPIIGAEDQPPVSINISSIPMKRKRA
jgi:hypothetical protein